MPSLQGNEAFSSARRAATRAELLSRLAGRDNSLLAFEQIRAELRRQNAFYQGVQQVPLSQIAGSVGRYHEFNRHFMPLNDSLRDRWIKIRDLANESGWPPVELYQVGEIYFVRDGNHRVSVARQMALDSIEAHVWRYPVEADIRPDEPVDDILLKLEEKRFMAETGLEKLIPDHDIRLTLPGRHRELQAQIADLQRKLSEIDGEPLSNEEAVRAWYEISYLPVAQIISESSLPAVFPGRTTADLVTWLSLHRERLADYYGRPERLADLAAELARRHDAGTLGRVGRSVRRLLGQDVRASLTLPPAVEEEE